MRFRMIFLIIALVELVSLVGHFFPWLNTIGFLVIITAALVLSLKRLEYGLCFVLADLILGGKIGALFSFEYSGFFLSLRMALFIVVMAVWLSKLKIKNFGFRNLDLGFLKWWGLLGVAVVWGLIVGLARGNNFGDLFLDANGYFYAALILPFFWVKPSWKNLGIVFFTATTWVAFETLFLVYFWTHGLNNYIAANLRPIYDWLRDTGVGEITWLEGNFARVFFQSHIYNIGAFFLLLAASDKLRLNRKIFYFLISINTAVILVALSRSFWLGTFMGCLVLFIFALRKQQARYFIQQIIVASVMAVLIIAVVARFPLPRPSAMDLSFLQDRSNITTDTAASRWNLLPPLTRAALEHPIIGSGFGRTVTYISNDPRIREVSITGEYTTYAFEWGWVDIWLKMGLVGLVGFLGLIGYLGLMLYRRAKIEPLYLGGLAILAALVTIHFFTPYLNHPLGLGILILTTILYDQKHYH